MPFVLDNSVAMRWLMESLKKADQQYAEAVLVSLSGTECIVPNLWHLEATNVLLSSEKRSDISIADTERFLLQLENLPINVDANTSDQCFNHILALSRAYKLSSYDAAYLELAIRLGRPLATLDKTLLKAAKKSGVVLYLK